MNMDEMGTSNNVYMSLKLKKIWMFVDCLKFLKPKPKIELAEHQIG